MQSCLLYTSLRLRHDLKLAAAQAVVVDSAKRK